MKEKVAQWYSEQVATKTYGITFTELDIKEEESNEDEVEQKDSEKQ